MKKKFITVYGIVASMVLVLSVAWFFASITRETRSGKAEAEKSFAWISREVVSASLADGFMTDAFIHDLTAICQKSRVLSAIVINTPSGAVFAWPQNTPEIAYDTNGTARITSSSFFMTSASTSLDIGDGTSGSVTMTVAFTILSPDAIFAASRNSFLVILALLFSTVIVILTYAPVKKSFTSKKEMNDFSVQEFATEGVSLSAAPQSEIIDDSAVTVVTTQEMQDDDGQGEILQPEPGATDTYQELAPQQIPDSHEEETEPKKVSESTVIPIIVPEGLFSPVTGTGWEQYLLERLDAELVRAASSEQDLSLIIIRIAGLMHTDLLAKKIAQVLLETFRFKDMVFEYGSNGFAGILQNMNLDEAMKTADSLYAGIDSILMEMSFDGQITIGITTRTARLLPASRMIEEASSAARKAEEEPSLPIVAFRANPEKYRNFVTENN